MEEEDGSSTCMASFCPSFSSYSRDSLVETADRVGREVADEIDGYCRNKNDVTDGGGDEEFEFVNFLADRKASVESGYDGLYFPVFDRDLISQSCAVVASSENYEVSATTVMTPLRDLFLRDGDDAASSSEDEVDEMPGEIYGPLTPARSTAEMSPSGGCKKSKSTGSSSTSSWSSKRWGFKDLLKRSHSEGKRSIVFLNSNSIGRRDREIGDIRLKTKEKKEKEKEKVSAHEELYLRNKAMKEEVKRKSYLPYRQDLVGLFANIRGYGRTFPPF